MLAQESIGVNARSSQDGTTCLHYAVTNCSTEIVMSLINKGANVNQLDGLGLVYSDLSQYTLTQ